MTPYDQDEALDLDAPKNLFPSGGVDYRFADTGQDLLCSGEIGEGLASFPPALAAIHINEQRSIQRDVAAVDAARGV